MIFEHRGYTLVQEEEENHHYMIFDENGDLRLHASYEGELFTQEEAEKHIDFFIDMARPNIEQWIGDDEE